MGANCLPTNAWPVNEFPGTCTSDTSGVSAPNPQLPSDASYDVMKASGHSLLFIARCSVDEKTPYLALGAVKNISLNISISNLGDDAYDANVSFNVSRELFFINMWQKVRKAPPKGSLCSVWCVL